MPIIGNNRKIFQVTIRGRCSGEQFSNVFWFEAPLAGSATSIGTANEINNVYMPGYGSFCHTNTFFDLIECINLADLSDFFQVVPTVTVGTVAGDPQPSFLAAKVKLLRGTRETRNGWKRIPGLVEGDTSNNLLANAARDRLQPLVDLFDNALFNGQNPIIFGRKIDPNTGKPFPYQQQFFSDVTGAEIAGITTQNSRKPGVGD